MFEAEISHTKTGAYVWMDACGEGLGAGKLNEQANVLNKLEMGRILPGAKPCIGG